MTGSFEGSHKVVARSPGHAVDTSAHNESRRSSPAFKNTMTLSQLIEKLVKSDVQDKDRAHAALALQYLSLNVDKASAILQIHLILSE